MLLISEQTVAAPETQVFVELLEPKPILKNISWVYENQNVTYIPTTFSLKNQQNYTVQVVLNFYSEPIEIMDFVIFDCSVENNTLIGSGETMPFTLYLTTFTNPSNLTGEYYLTVYGELI